MKRSYTRANDWLFKAILSLINKKYRTKESRLLQSQIRDTLFNYYYEFKQESLEQELDIDIKKSEEIIAFMNTKEDGNE